MNLKDAIPGDAWLPQIILCDKNTWLCQEWSQAFTDVKEVSVFCGDIRQLEAEAIVSPANSFGFMDGGIDALFCQMFGIEIQARVQSAIKTFSHGELLVGQALMVPIPDPIITRIIFLIAAPTMRTPRRIVDFDAVRLSTRAALQCAKDCNVQSVIMTGMGAGSGGVPPRECAIMMRKGFDDVFIPQPFPSSWREAAER